MKGIIFVSNCAYSGKTGIILALGKKLEKKGVRVGYFKPYGFWAHQIEGGFVDEDALYVAQTLDLKDDLRDLSPVFLDPERRISLICEEEISVERRVLSSFQNICRDKDIVFVEGGASFFEGETFGLSASRLSELLNLFVIVIVKGEPIISIDDALASISIFSKRLLGIIFNWVPLNSLQQINVVKKQVHKKEVKAFGFIPEDRTLLGVTVGELVEKLGGKILCCEDKREELVETFMVGAMGQEKALRFFRRKRDKAVITGGDRADIQLAALETPTKCLILTGNFYPSPFVLSRAEELGVPVVLVPDDTFTVVDKTEHLLGKIRIHEPEKIDRLITLLEENLDLKSLWEALGVS
jgi:hypothetical protein